MALLTEAKDMTKLVKTAVRLMVNDLKAERAIVLYETDGLSEPPPSAQYGFESDDIWNDRTVPTKVLRYVMQRKKPLYLADARKDEQVGNEHTNPSVVCVPLKDGFLYCDHSQPGALSKEIKEAVYQMAREFNQCHDRFIRAHNKEVSTQGYEDFEFKQGPYVGDCLTLVQGFSVLVFASIVAAFVWLMTL